MSDFDVLDPAIRKVPDFPRQGILFYDITGILAKPEVFRYCIDRMEERYRGGRIDAIGAVEARGFIFAAPLSVRLGVPLILIRKKGKLPGKTIERSFELEYGEDTVELHPEDVPAGAKVLLVDDLIATGGTIKAAAQLVEDAGATVAEIFSVVALPFLPFKRALEGYDLHYLIAYNSESTDA
ncbi:MAG: adenine phosphoribosyltransferase [Alkalispirochaetaceae bacterium]